jgi:ribosomal protein L7/L12
VDYEEVVALVRKEVGSGLSVEGAIVRLNNAGLTITQSIKALAQLFGMSLAEAKSVTATHPVWVEITKAAEPLHDELERAMKKDKSKS